MKQALMKVEFDWNKRWWIWSLSETSVGEYGVWVKQMLVKMEFEWNKRWWKWTLSETSVPWKLQGAPQLFDVVIQDWIWKKRKLAKITDGNGEQESRETTVNTILVRPHFKCYDTEDRHWIRVLACPLWRNPGSKDRRICWQAERSETKTTVRVSRWNVQNI